MAIAYKFISRTVLGSQVSSITLSNIPQTFNDLELYINGDGTGYNATDVRIQFNSSGGTAYSDYYLIKDGSSATPIYGTDSSISYAFMGYIPGSNTLSNIWGGMKIYIPNYISTANNKYFNSYFATEANTNDQFMGMIAGRWNNTSAINTITLSSAGSYLANTTVSLYGIKNS